MRNDAQSRKTIDGRVVVDTLEGPVVARNSKHARFLRMTSAGDLMATREDCDKVLAEASGQCAYCGETFRKLTIDHIIPLSRGGLHVVDNIVAACFACNNKKADRTPGEWGVTPYWYLESVDAD